jgi:Ca2+-binding EF-hand superfamily protein
VKPSYDKFDKDGNGTIDLNELGQLSAELGQPLSEE